MHTRNYEGILFNSGKESTTLDTLSVEAPLQIYINGKPFSITMRTPGEDKYLIRGLLHSEGVIKNALVFPLIEEIDTNDSSITTYNVVVPNEELKAGYANSRSLLSVASCGICGKTELEDHSCENELVSDQTIDPKELSLMFELLSENQDTFKRSGGSHAAAAFDKDNRLICSYEDIGRHNAVDKVVGNLISSDRYGTAKSLLVSGRVSYEIVVKSFKARIPILASVSAPSTLAVDYAKELGITLFSFCRDKRATCYANIRRIANDNINKAV